MREESILKTIKKLLMVPDDVSAFDKDILVGINTTLMTLNQFGVGPRKQFFVVDDTTTWGEYLPENFEEYQSVVSYVALRTKMIFDPPTSSSVMDVYKEEIAELEFRLHEQAEGTFTTPVEEGG